MPTLTNLTKLAIVMQVHLQYSVKLKWHNNQLSDSQAKPVNALIDSPRWFHKQQDSSLFISETVDYGSLVCTGERFSKTWRLQNTGDTVWQKRKLQCQDATNAMLQQQFNLKPFIQHRSFSLTPLSTSIDVLNTKPGDTIDITVMFIVPTIPAAVFSYRKMVDATDAICFANAIGI